MIVILRATRKERARRWTLIGRDASDYPSVTLHVCVSDPALAEIVGASRGAALRMRMIE